MTLRCVTTTHWATHVTAECAPGGSGICYGTCDAHGDECSCSCHRSWTNDLPDTVEGVRRWHDKANDVVASFDGTHAVVEATAIAAAKGLQAVDTDKVYAAQRGQDRYFVTATYR